MIVTRTHTLTTSGQGDAHDLTPPVTAALRHSELRAGIVTVFVVGSTAAITTLEFEPGVVQDLERASKRWRRARPSTGITSAGATTTGRAMSVPP